MSRRQVTTKEREQIDRQRSLNRERSAAHQAESERQRKALEELREASQGKLQQAVKARKPSQLVLPLSKGQALVLLATLAVLGLAWLNMATRKGPSVSAVLNGLVVRAVNRQRRGYSLGANRFFEGWLLEEVPQLFRVNSSDGLPACPALAAGPAAPPARYSSRRRLAACAAPVQDQGNCTGSHAFAVAGMLRDRYCLASGGKRKFDASPQHLLHCLGSAGCEEGDLAEALRLAAGAGLANTVCAPDADAAACREERIKACPRLRFASVCAVAGPAQIKLQILRHGPVVALLSPSLELLLYKNGDFHGAQARKIAGAQAVKLVGWDADAQGREVWLVENSWGSSWGLKGLARVRVGADALLESTALAGFPDPEPRSISSSSSSVQH